MAADLPIRLTLIQAVAWIFTRDPRIIQRAAWKCSRMRPLTTRSLATIYLRSKLALTQRALSHASIAKYVELR